MHTFSKRPLAEKTPNIRPIKVTKRALTTTPESQASVQEGKELDAAILRSFVGKSKTVVNHSCNYAIL